MIGGMSGWLDAGFELAAIRKCNAVATTAGSP